MRPDVVAVVPTYNEANTIAHVVSALRSSGYTVLVVDDGSPDGTGAIVESLAASDPEVRIMHRTTKAGLGAAYAAALPEALHLDPDAVVTIDADLSHDPAAAAGLVAALSGGAGLAIGSRYVPGGATPGWSRRRRALSRWGNRYAAFILRSRIHDLTSGFRAWRPEALRRVLEAPVEASGYAFQIETAARAEAQGVAVREIPITFRDRTAGDSKMSIRVVVEALWLVTRWGLGGRRRLR